MSDILQFPTPPEASKRPQAPDLPPELVDALIQADALIQDAGRTIANTLAEVFAAFDVPEVLRHPAMGIIETKMQETCNYWARQLLQQVVPGTWARKQMEEGDAPRSEG